MYGDDFMGRVDTKVENEDLSKLVFGQSVGCILFVTDIPCARILFGDTFIIHYSAVGVFLFVQYLLFTHLKLQTYYTRRG